MTEDQPEQETPGWLTESGHSVRTSRAMAMRPSAAITGG